MIAAPTGAAAEAPWAPWLARAAILLVVVAAYANSLHGPFIFDDVRGIVTNPNIRTLAPPASLMAPAGTGASGRPVVALSLALNYALGGLEVAGYHALNVALHLAAAMTLFELSRLALTAPRVGASVRAAATPLAAAVALVWAGHPLNSDALNHVISRSEVLLALCFLLTLYAALRACATRGGQPLASASGSDRARDAGAVRARRASEGPAESPAAGPAVCSGARWAAAAVVFNALGMASKEAMAAAPLVVLLADRALYAGGFAAAMRQRPAMYAGLAGGWAVLVLCVLVGDRGESVGLEAGGLTPVTYAMTQVVVVAHYLRLAFWPHPLVLDYGDWPVGESINHLLAAAPMVAAALAGAIALVARNAAIGVPAAAFFLVLAPSSTFIPLSGEPTAEHRMYLPLCAIVLIATITLFAALRRVARRGAATAVLALAACAATAGTWGTVQRNADYATEERIWKDAIAHHPENARAHNNLGFIYGRQNRPADALAAYREALRLDPKRAEFRRNVGAALLDLGRTSEALRELQAAIADAPTDAKLRFNLGLALTRLGRARDAIAEFEAGLAIAPNDARAHAAFADALERVGDTARAAQHWSRFEALSGDRR